MERLSFSFARKSELAYISHLDMMRLLLRALRRSDLPIAYSQGYNPHPRLTLALPLPLGVTASEEYGEVYFSEPVGSKLFLEKLSRQLPPALELTGAIILKPELPALAAEVSAAQYRVFIETYINQGILFQELNSALNSLMNKEEVLMERRNKKKKVTYKNVRPYIFKANLEEEEEQGLELNLLLKAGSSGGVSPFFVIEQLQAGSALMLKDNGFWQVHRQELYKGPEEALQPLSEGM